MRHSCLSIGRPLVFALLITVIAAPAAPLVINEFLANNTEGLRDGDGNREDWIEIFNPNTEAVSLAGYGLSDDITDRDKWEFPTGTMIEAGAYLIVFASGDGLPDSGGQLHTNFRLSADGEYLGLVGIDGETVESEFAPAYPRQKQNVSFGQSGQGAGLQFFAESTPGAINGEGFEGVVRDTTFSVDRGFYESEFDVEITSLTEDAEIRYTLNGDWPSATNGIIYTGPITISGTSVLRAIATKEDFLETDVDSHSYIFIDQVVNQPTDPDGWPSDWEFDSQVGGDIASDYEMDPRVRDGAIEGYSVREALLDIPTMSISLKQSDFTGPNGMYTNPRDRGPTFEDDASVELIYPDGREGFQENCELRIHGNSSRRPFRMQKHSMRLTFRSEIGSSKLRFPLFDGEGREEFNKIVLRACFTDSWGLATWSRARYRPNDSQYMRDVWMKESQKAMGHLSGSGNFVHLYVNGLYFGLFNPSERLEEEFYAKHLGGEEENWENHADFLFREPLSAAGPLWRALVAASRAPGGLSIEANYRAVEELVDIDNLIDYMILHFYADSEDWPSHNGYAAANAVDGDGKFRFYVWDQEIALDKFSWNRYNSTGNSDNSPGSLFQRLRSNDEFIRRFGDRVQKHLFADGALSQENSAGRYLAICNQIDKAIVAESARWGDTAAHLIANRDPRSSRNYPERLRQPRPLDNFDDDDYPPILNGTSIRSYYLTRENSWLVERDNVINHYIPVLHDETDSRSIIREMRAANLFPDTDAPVFSQFGGDVPSGFEVTFTSNEPVYFTTDGTDPIGSNEEPSSTATLSSGAPIVITDSITLRARARNATTNEWSAISEGFFNTANLQVSEIYYNPPEGRPAQFVELVNTGGGTVDLTGATFTRGIDFTFEEGGPVTSLAAGERLLIVNDVDVFRANNGTAHDSMIAGSFQNGTTLDRGGETLELSTATGDILFSFRYNDKDPWPESADGSGSSLVYRGFGDPSEPSNWRPSTSFGGNPGTTDSSVFPGGDTAAFLAYAMPGNFSISTSPSGEMLLEVSVNISADEIARVPQSSSDLETWDADNPMASFTYLATGVPDTSGVSTETYRISFAEPRAERLFFRVLVEERE